MATATLGACVAHNPIATHVIQFGGLITAAYLSTECLGINLVVSITLFVITMVATRIVIGYTTAVHWRADCTRCDRINNPPDGEAETLRHMWMFRFHHRMHARRKRHGLPGQIALAIAEHGAMIAVIALGYLLAHYLAGDTWGGPLLLAATVAATSVRTYYSERHHILAGHCPYCYANDERSRHRVISELRTT